MCLRCGFGPLICSTDTSCTRCCFDGSSAGIDTKEEEEDHAARRWIMPWDGRLPHETDACDVTNGNDLLTVWSLAKNNAFNQENLPGGTVVVLRNPAASTRLAKDADAAPARCVAMPSGFRRANGPNEVSSLGDPSTNTLRNGPSWMASEFILGVVVERDGADDQAELRDRVKVRAENGFLLLQDPHKLMPVRADNGARVWVRMKVAPEERGDADSTAAAHQDGEDLDYETAPASGWMLIGNALAPRGDDSGKSDGSSGVDSSDGSSVGDSSGNISGDRRNIPLSSLFSLGGCCPSMSNLLSARCEDPQDARWIVVRPDTVLLRQRPSMDSPAAQSSSPLAVGTMLRQDITCSASSSSVFIEESGGGDENTSNDTVIASLLGHAGTWRS